MTNLSPTNLTPGAFLQLNIPFGPGSTIVAPQKTLYIGNKLASASAVANQLYGPDVPGFVVQTHADVLTYFGAGSEQDLAYNQGVLVDNSYTKKYFICPTESTGNAAAVTVTFTGTATTFGVVNTWTTSGWVTANVNSGATAAQVATAVATSINASTEANVSAVASTDTVVVTAKNKGPRGNQIYFASQVAGGLQGITSSAQTFAKLTGGTVEDSFVATLAAIANTQFDLIVTGAEDAGAEGNAGILVAQVISQNLAVPGLRCYVFDGFNGSEAQCASFTNQLNSVFAAVLNQVNSGLVPIQLAAAYAAATAACFYGQTSPLWNMDSVGVRTGPGTSTASFLPVPAPPDGSQPSPTDITASLVSGVTPVGLTPAGQTYIVKAVTSYSVNPTTETLDLRATDLCDPFIGNVSLYALQSMWGNQFAGTTAAQNPQPGDKAPNELVTTPDILTAAIDKVLARQVSNGALQDYVVTSVTLNSTGTFFATVEIEPVTLAHQFSVDINVTTSII